MRMMNKYRAVLLLVVGFVSANNDECTSPLRLFENEPVSGDNSFAVSDFTDVDACGPNSHLEGVWYEIIGTGEEVTLSICTENQRLLSVGVFSACNSQSCVGFPARPVKPASCNRDEYLTYQFFAERDRSYRVHVRSNVIDFSSFTLGAEFKIFYRTSSSPTAAPTASRTAAPTIGETTTRLPPVGSPITNLPINSQLPYLTSDLGKVSTCKSTPPTSSRVESETITYDYTLSKNPSSAAGTALEIEEALHQTLSDRLLTCAYSNTLYDVVEVAIGDRDTVRVCSGSFAGNACSVVRGSMNMELAIPNGGRRLNENLYADLIPVFQSTLQGFGGQFQGFTDSQSVVSDPVENDGVANDEIIVYDDDYNYDDDYGYYVPAEEEPEETSPLLLGLGIAIGLIVLIILLLCVRRKLRGESDKPHEGVLEPAQDEESTVKQIDSPAHEVDDEDINGDGVAFFSTIKLEGSDHDFRSCGNPECEHCKPESRPVFISTGATDETIDENKGVETMAYHDGWAIFGRNHFASK
ncbi:unnamed protein product [Cylindrotheca closterium]|uniref:Uncharacterized protein n=1 Tax=Cylindrotheca closterium TaxID=2856 RepID=A0AAD2FID3_9STRA|nr:unnamed protein product [Cylindrotheca closterium]